MLVVTVPVRDRFGLEYMAKGSWSTGWSEQTSEYALADMNISLVNLSKISDPVLNPQYGAEIDDEPVVLGVGF